MRHEPLLDVSLRFTLCGPNEKRPTQHSPWEEWLADTARNVRTRIARPSESAVRLILSTWLCVSQLTLRLAEAVIARIDRLWYG